MSPAFVTVASLVFGMWQPVTPATMLEHVPEVVAVGIPGAAQRYQKAEIVGCPVKDGSKVVGWSFNCFPSAPRGGNRGAL